MKVHNAVVVNYNIIIIIIVEFSRISLCSCNEDFVPKHVQFFMDIEDVELMHECFTPTKWKKVRRKSEYGKESIGHEIKKS